MHGNRQILGAVLGGMLVLCWANATHAETVKIDNAALEVRYDTNTGRFSLTSKPAAKAFVAEGRLLDAGGSAKVAAVADPTFGAGRAIEISYANGNRDQILLYPGLPFVLFRTTLHNGGKQPTITNKVRTLSASVDLDKPADALKVLGTGGLTSPDKNPGSYMWLAVAEPQSRHGVVGGWLSTDRGSGVVLAASQSGQVRIDAQIDYGRLRLALAQSEPLETFALGYFDDARLGLEAWADAVARVYHIQLPPQPTGYCTWYHAGASSEKQLPAQAAFAAKHLAPFGFSVVQIDDGWQDGEKKNGPRKNFTQVRAGGPYPSGMKAAADAVKRQGLVPGLWLMPFSGTYDDPWFQDHQDWFVKREDGTPHDSKWGGTCLDMTHPDARDYLRGIIHRMVHDWGFQYLKMDGLASGVGVRHNYVNDAYDPVKKDDKLGDGVFHNPDKTNVEAYRDGLKLVRDTAGKDVYLLGCCASQNMRSYGGAFGLVDAMRVGPDNKANWQGILRGPAYGSRNYHLHGRIWYNDPDPIYVRPAVPLEQARAICSWVTISGQIGISSEDYLKLPPERLEILKRTIPSHGLRPRPADLFETSVPRIWLLTDDGHAVRRDVLGLFNWDAAPYTFDYPLERTGLSAQTEYAAFDFWANGLVAPLRERLRLTVPPQSCVVLALRPVLDHPVLLSTSRHITQGIIDVLDEQWDAAARELSGTSKVVGGDAYQLRVATHTTKGNWKAVVAAVSPEDSAAGVSVSMKEEPGLVRVTIQSASNREVKWKVRFEGK